MSNDYKFTTNWFNATAKPMWDKLLQNVKISKALEIGCFEGAATTYLINRFKNVYDLEVHCIDNWGGNGIESTYNLVDMDVIEKTFDHNINIALKVNSNIKVHKHKGNSDIELAKLLSNGFINHFDLIYVDGSHLASDVLTDAVLSFKLLKIGGLMIFDDYVWNDEKEGKNILKAPKVAIDNFVNTNYDKVRIVQSFLSQFFIQKISN